MHSYNSIFNQQELKRSSRLSVKSGWKQTEGHQPPGITSIPHTTDNASVISAISAVTGGNGAGGTGGPHDQAKDMMR